MRFRGIRIEPFGIEHVEFVHTVGKYILFHLSRDAAARGDGFEFHSQFVGQLAAFREEFERNLLHTMLVYFAIYENVIHDIYPIVWLSNNSFTSPSMSASPLPNRLLSFALNTMFCTAFTFVGEPARPHCARSPSTSATLHCVTVR